MTRYVLRRFDQDLLAFELVQDRYNYPLVTDTQVLGDVRLLPEKVDQEPETVLRWLKRRMIPSNRAFIREILACQNLSPADLEGQLRISLGLSVNDPFWVCEETFPGSWKDLNLYENSFSQALSLVAFTGWSTTIDELSPSPEMTTNGQLPKTWRREAGELVLYKGSTDERLFANGGKEPYSEYLAAQVAQAMGIDHVPYDLVRFKGMLASTCRNFTSPDVSYVPMSAILKTASVQELIDFFKERGDQDQLAAMVLLDAIILNEDRHFGNFGLLKDNRTNEYLRLAPLFDHGISLLAHCSDARLASPEARKQYIREAETSRFGISHERLVRDLCGPKECLMLRKLLTFHFTEHPRYRLDPDRMRILEDLVQERARYFLTVLDARSES